MTGDSLNPLKVGKGRKSFGYINVVRSLPIMAELPIGVVRGSSKGPTMAVTGGLFPTEYDGIEAASRLCQMVNPQDLSGTLLIVPVVNMPCLQFRTPWFNLTESISPMDGANINSVFPGNLEGTVTEAIAYTLFRRVILKSDYHIDLRGGDLNESHLAYTMFLKLGKNKETDKKCEDIANVAGFKYTMAATREYPYTRRGSLIYEAVTRGICSVVFLSGLGYRTQPLRECVLSHVNGVTNAMKHLGMIKGRPVGSKEPDLLSATPNRIKTPVAGFFHANADQGDIVKRKQLLGEIVDMDGSQLARIISPVDGVVQVMLPRRLVYTGDTLFNVRTVAHRRKK